MRAEASSAPIRDLVGFSSLLETVHRLTFSSAFRGDGCSWATARAPGLPSRKWPGRSWELSIGFMVNPPR